MVMRYSPLSELSSEVKIVDGKLIVGTMEIDTEGYPCTENKVPICFCVRVLRDGFWGFVTGFNLVDKWLWVGGFDLKQDRRISVPRAAFEGWYAIEKIFNEMCCDTVGKDWKIFIESEFYASAEDEYECEMNQARSKLEMSRLTDES